MDIKFYLQILSIAFDIGLSLSIIIDIVFIDYIPSPFVIVALAFCWVWTIKRNEVFHELLRKWGWKK
jgi:hypothetical protein